MEPSDRKVKVISTLNERPRSWGVRHDLAFVCLGIFILTYAISYVFLGIPPSVGGFFAILFAVSWVYLARDSPHDFLSKFIPLPGDAYHLDPLLFIPASDKRSFERKMNHQPQDKTLIVNNKKQKLPSFHKESRLHAVMEIDFGGTIFALYLKYDKKTGWSATIPFVMDGIHTEIVEEDALGYAVGLTKVLKGILPGETLTFFLGGRSKYDRREKQLNKLRENNNLYLVDSILANETVKAKMLTERAKRQQWDQYTYVSWQEKKQYLEDDAVGTVANFLGNFIEPKLAKFTGMEEDRNYNIYTKIAQDIYHNSFCEWESILEKKGQLKVSPLTGDKAWEHLWYKYNNTAAPECPQIIRVSRRAGEYRCHVEVADRYNLKDTFSVLFENNNIPQHKKQRDSIECGGNFIGALVLKSSDKNWEWPNIRSQMLSVWSKLSESGVRDVEIFTQFTKRSKSQTEKDLKIITKQNAFREKDAIIKGEGANIDASFKQEEAIEAQARLYLGADTLHTAVVIFLYRNTYEQLDHACKQIQNIFAPTYFKREDQVCLDVWLEAQFFNNRKLLMSSNTFTERRYVFDSLSGRGVVPLAKPQTLHKRGVELITEEGSFPIHLDLLENNERMIILGTAGSGKSVFGSEFITYALAQKAKCVIVDMSKAGESSYKVYVDQLEDEGAYINLVTDKYSNILQPPDIHSYKILKEDKATRLAIWKEFLQTIIVAMVMGQGESTSQRHGNVTSIIITLLKVFFDNENINHRYNRAFEDGWKSEAWQNMPVLKDLLFFCSLTKLGLEHSYEYDEAVKFIRNRIESKLNDPNIGKAIGSVSNVPPTPSVVMFALSGLNNEDNSYIMSLVAQMACLNVSLEAPTSLALFDEVSELLRKAGFIKVLASLFTRGRKEGMSVVLIGQELESIVSCEARKQLIDNTNYWAIGNIQGSVSPQYYAQELNISLQAVSQNRATGFAVDRKQMRSRFLVKGKNRHWHCFYYSSPLSLALVANSRHEVALRKKIMEHYPNTKRGRRNGLLEFAKILYQNYSHGNNAEEAILTINKNSTSKSDRTQRYIGSGYKH